MRDDLLAYYERELTFLRQLGAEFAERYPKIAGRLVLEEDKCEDPHVERLIEAFAFLAGRIHRKLDDELPEITEALLSVLYPHYLAPIPSMSIVQFAMDTAQARLQTGQTVKRDSMLSSKPVEGSPCRFRTCYPVTIWPVVLAYADRSLMGYRLLQEFFAFPEKFLFFDLCELDRAAAAGVADVMELRIHFDREFPLERAVSAQTFRLNCTAIVNLFHQVAEPIQMTHTQTEYRVVPDVRRQLGTEVYSVDAVMNVAPHLEEPIHYQPFYSYKHALDRDRERTFWHSSRRQSARKDDEGTE